MCSLNGDCWGEDSDRCLMTKVMRDERRDASKSVPAAYIAEIESPTDVRLDKTHCQDLCSIGYYISAARQNALILILPALLTCWCAFNRTVQFPSARLSGSLKVT